MQRVGSLLVRLWVMPLVTATAVAVAAAAGWIGFDLRARLRWHADLVIRRALWAGPVGGVALVVGSLFPRSARFGGR